MPAQSCLHSSAVVFVMARGGWQAPKGKLHSLQCLSKFSCFDWVCWCAAAVFNGKAVSGELPLWSPQLKPPQAHISVPLSISSEIQFSAFHALGAAISCVEIIHDNPTALCRNRGLLPALLTLHMFYLSKYLFICHSWIGCFAICSFSTMIQIYSDFRGLIWRNSTVGGQTFSGTKPLCCSVPSDFLIFPSRTYFKFCLFWHWRTVLFLTLLL